MKTENTPQWLAEFGPEYAVPDAIAKAADVTDESWHNEVSPKFWMREVLKRDGKTYRVEIWADHPEQAERETQGENRYWVTLAEVDSEDHYLANDEDRQLCESNDAEKVMRVARRLFNPAPVEDVAKAFADVLKEWLTPDEMRQAIERNRTEEIEGVCHSHDFCDANMAMEAALQKFDMEADVQSEELAAFWGKAWDIAKKNGFWFAEVQS